MSRCGSQQECAGLPAGAERDAKEAEIRAEVGELQGSKAIAPAASTSSAPSATRAAASTTSCAAAPAARAIPGRSKFFLSLQDDLMRIFGSERMDSMLAKLGLKEDEAIVHPWINKALEKAQQKVEARNFDIRKNILKYDNVMNDQRKVIFEQRREMMAQEVARARRSPTCAQASSTISSPSTSRTTPIPRPGTSRASRQRSQRMFNLDLPVDDWAKEEGIADEEMRERLHKAADEAYAERVERNTARGHALRREAGACCRRSTISGASISSRSIICARSSAGAAMAQRDPLNEYKSEAFELFGELIAQLARSRDRADDAHRGAVPAAGPGAAADAIPASRPAHRPERGGFRRHFRTDRRRRVFLRRSRLVAAPLLPMSLNAIPKDPQTWGKVGRNEACPCGSGKKYKHCHGMLA